MKTDYESTLGFIAILSAIALLVLSIMKSCAMRNRAYCDIFHGDVRVRTESGYIYCPKCGDNFEE